MAIIVAFFTQLAFTVGAIFLFGFAISLCNRQFYRNFGSEARAVCYLTGFIGTPVHELSHAFFCLVFGHRIVEIKLFQINSDDGTLGYVRHTYNHRNVYQSIGNFFIGTAPIIVISALLYLLAYFLLPSFGERVLSLSGSMSLSDVGGLFSGLWEAAAAFFSLITAWQWWVFLLAGIFLALHMSLSGADIKGALSGLGLLAFVLLVADVVLGLVWGDALILFTKGVLCVAYYLVCFLILALAISLLSLAVSFIFRLIFRR